MVCEFPSVVELTYEGSYIASTRLYHLFRLNNVFYKVGKITGEVSLADDNFLSLVFSA
jgi:hypothetical protein